jgi:hypothetical protein
MRTPNVATIALCTKPKLVLLLVVAAFLLVNKWLLLAGALLGRRKVNSK